MNNYLKALLKSWQKKAANPLAWSIILIVVVLIAGTHFLVLTSRPGHTVKMADELGIIGGFIGSPAATGDGTRISFFRGTEMGAGLFICDLASGQQRLLYEVPGTGSSPVQFGWSPDGKLLAISTLKNEHPVIMICNGDSGQIETTVYVSTTAFTWLSPSSFVFLNGSSMQQGMKQVGLMRVDKLPDIGWGQPYRFTTEEKMPGQPGMENAPKYTPVKGLMTTSSDSMAWLARNAIWEWKFHADAPVRLWRGASTNRILECRFSKDTGAFLLRLLDTNGAYLASYLPGSQQPANLGRIDNTNTADLMWVNHGKGYAYLLNESGLHSLFIKANYADERPIEHFPLYGVREALTANETCIYAAGCLEKQPKGIIEFDAASSLARYVVPSPVSFVYSQNAIPSSGTITNSLGSIHAYRIWAPVHFDPRKKYPLILDQWTHGWYLFAETAANAGAYYVSVERPDWVSPQISEWEQDVMAAYQLMSKNPNIDTNRVYLDGSCDESVYLVQLLNDEPTLWRGAIVHTSIAFPDLSQTHVAKMMINYGETDDSNIVKNIKGFQEEAAEAGIPVTVVPLHSGHFYISSASTQRNTLEMIQFLAE
jgi:hypothetical protein